MRALLLAAGLGTRLRPVTNSVPKCLVPIDGRPLLDHWLALLLHGGMERILVNTHYLPDLVRRHLDESPLRAEVDVVYEAELLGTGGTTLANAEFFGDDDFLVAHADNLAYFDVEAFLSRHRSRPKPDHVLMTMMTFASDDPKSCGIVEHDAEGLVCGFHEKVAEPPGNLANAAVYLFAPAMLEVLRASGRSVIDLSTEVIPQCLGRITTWHNEDYLRDIGNIQSLEQAAADARTHPALAKLDEICRSMGV
ncbi:MAG: nucleotidyltransferase family protein [Pseudomonadota bacterium]